MMTQFRNRLRQLNSLFQDTEATKDAFAALLDQTYNYNFQKGAIVRGKVVSKDSHGLMVDIGAKTLAIVPFREIADRANADDPKSALVAGEDYEFYILRPEDENGQLTLSRKRVAIAYAWKQMEVYAAEDKVLECTIVGRVRGGALGLVEGVRGFIPSSHLGVKQPIDALVNTTLPVKILSLDIQRNNLILSHKKVISEQLHSQRRELFEGVTVGAVIEGQVVRLTDFGAFVDLGGIDGLLPLSQMSWRWVEHPSDLLTIGDTVRVEVISVDIERQRISLSVKSLQEDPWLTIDQHFALNQSVDGTITRIKPFGAFVEITPGVEALLPSRDLQELENQRGEKLASGTKITGYINRFSVDERRISLGLYPIAQQEETV